MRKSGMLMPVSALPGAYGIGCFSKEAYEFVDILKEASANECNEKDKLEAIYEIANLLAETLTTQFINNNYAITEQYNTIHSQIESINNNLYSAPVLSDVNWSNVRLLMR